MDDPNEVPSSEDVRPANTEWSSPQSGTMPFRIVSGRSTQATIAVAFLTLLVFSLSIALWTSRRAVTQCPNCNCGAQSGAPPQSEEGAETTLGLGTTIFTAALMLCVGSAYLKLQNGFTTVPDCIIYVLLGALIGSVLRVSSQHHPFSFSFPNEEQFFIFILPPIMFEAGYSLSKTDFFAEAAGILMFAIPGTIISSLVFGAGVYLVGLLGASYTFTLWEALTFGALISAVDPVATIAVFSALRVNKTLHILGFRRSVLNDAVSIVLYRTFSELIGSSDHWYSPLDSFLRVFIGSSIIGTLNGVLSSLILKHTSLYRTPQLEMAVFLLMAYFPYFVCDAFGMSGIMAILANGAVLAHYAHFNLSKITQISAQQIFRTLAFLAEAFVFVFLGTALTSLQHSWDGLTIFWGIFFVLLSRAANIYPLSQFVNKWRVDKISYKNQFIMWFSGLRGAVSFALSLNFPSMNGSDDTRRIVISSTLAIVLFTVVVLGGGTTPLLTLLGVDNERSEENQSLSSQREATVPLAEEDASPGGEGRFGGLGHETHPRLNAFSTFLQRVDKNWLGPWLLASSTRAMVATNRTLQTLAVTDGARLTPHQLGQVLDSSAAAVPPSPFRSGASPKRNLTSDFSLNDGDDIELASVLPFTEDTRSDGSRQ